MVGKRPVAASSRRGRRSRSMDDLCDAIMVEEILPRMSPKSLLCLGAASRRYNAMVLDPDFAARYWPRAGVFFQPLRITGPAPDHRPLYLSSSGRPPAMVESMFGADLSFLPAPSTREKAYLRHVGTSELKASVIVVVHSAAGLLLCCRGRTNPVHYYICNPVSGQWAALPELPCPSNEWQSGMLRVHTDGGAAKKPKMFQVLLFNHPMHWQKPGGCLDLRLFSSDTGQWKKVQLKPPIHVAEDILWWSPIGQSCNAYWIIRIEDEDHAIVYNTDKHSAEVVLLPGPPSIGNFLWKQCSIIGERHGGDLRYAISNSSVFEVWDSQTEGGDRMWTMAHQVRVAELLERNPEAADFLFISPSRTSITPLGFHPTDDDVVFLGTTGAAEAVAAYSIENGTVSLHQFADKCYTRSRNMLPYVHPPYLVQIPAIKNSIPAHKFNHS